MKKKQEIIDLINKEEPVFLHFYSMNCEKGKMNQSTFRDFQKTEDCLGVNTENIEIKRQPNLAEDLGIEGAPIVLLFVKGEERWRRGGAVAKDVLVKALEVFGKNN